MRTRHARASAVNNVTSSDPINFAAVSEISEFFLVSSCFYFFCKSLLKVFNLCLNYVLSQLEILLAPTSLVAVTTPTSGTVLQ